MVKKVGKSWQNKNPLQFEPEAGCNQSTVIQLLEL